MYNLFQKDVTFKLINRYIHQNHFLEASDQPPILSKIYLSIAYQAFLNTNKEWEEMMKRAMSKATDDESRAYIHFLFAKNYLTFDNGTYTDGESKKAKENYIKSLEVGTQDQKRDFEKEIRNIWFKEI